MTACRRGHLGVDGFVAIGGVEWLWGFKGTT